MDSILERNIREIEKGNPCAPFFSMRYLSEFDEGVLSRLTIFDDKTGFVMSILDEFQPNTQFERENKEIFPYIRNGWIVHSKEYADNYHITQQCCREGWWLYDYEYGPEVDGEYVGLQLIHLDDGTIDLEAFPFRKSDFSMSTYKEYLHQNNLTEATFSIKDYYEMMIERFFDTPIESRDEIWGIKWRIFRMNE